VIKIPTDDFWHNMGPYLICGGVGLVLFIMLVYKIGQVYQTMMLGLNVRIEPTVARRRDFVKVIISVNPRKTVPATGIHIAVACHQTYKERYRTSRGHYRTSTKTKLLTKRETRLPGEREFMPGRPEHFTVDLQIPPDGLISSSSWWSSARVYWTVTVSVEIPSAIDARKSVPITIVV